MKNDQKVLTLPLFFVKVHELPFSKKGEPSLREAERTTGKIDFA